MIRRPQRFPNVAVTSASPEVSSSPVPPCSPPLARPLAAVTARAVSSVPLAMAPSRPQPSPLAYEPANALSASEGAQITQLLLLPCSVAWFPSIAELRQPQKSSPPAAPATPAPPVGPPRCARARATSWCPWRVDPSSLAQLRRATAALGRRRRPTAGESDVAVVSG